jgi:hypothetical protein
VRKFKPEEFEKEKLLKKVRKILKARNKPTIAHIVTAEVFDSYFGKKWRRNEKLWMECFRLAWRFAQISRSKNSGIKSEYDKSWGSKVYWIGAKTGKKFR